MIVRSIEKNEEDYFLKLCRDFYSSGGTIRAFDLDIARKTFSQLMSKHENLWGFFICADAEPVTPIGYALISSYWSNEDGGNIIVLDELFVDPLYRNKGYGKAFLVWLEEEFKDKAACITLEVLSTNTLAKSVYEKDGLIEDGFVTLSKRIS